MAPQERVELAVVAMLALLEGTIPDLLERQTLAVAAVVPLFSRRKSLAETAALVS
jgi:hypothetical protein